MNNSLPEIEKKLRNVVEREKRRDGLKKLFIFIAVFCFAFLIIVLLELVGNFNSAFRTVLFYLTASASLLVFTLYVAYPLIKDFIYYSHPDYVGVSKKIGNYFPEIKDELANAVQILNEKNSNYSNQLIDAAFKNVYG
ncbi:MAG: hypothetical protein ACYC4T_13650, partial [Melioribacteraceae bacterium]